MDASLNRKIRRIVEDGIVTEDEALALIKEYDNLRYKSDLELKQWLNQHEYDIKLKNYNITVTNRKAEENRKIVELQAKLDRASRESKQAQEYAGLLRREQWKDGGVGRKPPPRPKPHVGNAIGNNGKLPKLPRLPRLTPRKKQRLIWLAIVGPAAIASLILL